MNTLIKNLVLTASLLLLPGCYHFGTPANHTFALADVHVENKTKEPTLGTFMNAMLREQICGDPAATLGKHPENVFHIQVKLNELDNLYLARAEMRDNKSRDDDSDAYQSVLFRIALKADVIVTSQDGKKVILQKAYNGYGDLPKMHDREIPFKHACKQAVNSIANQIVDDIANVKP